MALRYPASLLLLLTGHSLILAVLRKGVHSSIGRTKQRKKGERDLMQSTHFFVSTTWDACCITCCCRAPKSQCWGTVMFWENVQDFPPSAFEEKSKLYKEIMAGATQGKPVILLQ